VGSSPPAIVLAMAEDKGTSTPEQPKESTRGIHIPRVVVVVLLASLIVSCIVLFFFAKDVAAFFVAGRDVDKRAVLWGIRTVAVLVGMGALWLLIRIGYDYQWTGLGQAELHKPKDVELRPKKTLWDWLQLLIVPIVLSLITVAFTWQQDARQQEAEERRAKVDRQIEEHRADDAALQAYLDQMNNLLLEHNLRESDANSEVRILARARTLTVFERLDPRRKAQALQFLAEASLVETLESEIEPVISLDQVDLSGANLDDAELFNADLDDADLSHASLYGANLRYASLNHANLNHADLSQADLRQVDLGGALLNEAHLNGAELYGATLNGAELHDADLSDALLGGGIGLQDDADLLGANLRDADLEGAAVSVEQLDLLSRTHSLLKGATMPNGQKYEEWIKSKDQGENKKSDGSS
jgi:uncharacterized protein YjbI with pentapeptide repeats